MTVVADEFVQDFYRIEHEYINRFMCKSEFCPCSEKINFQNLWYNDMFLMGKYENRYTTFKKEGATNFYRDCYVPLLENGIIKFPIHPNQMDLIRDIEDAHNC